VKFVEKDIKSGSLASEVTNCSNGVVVRLPNTKRLQ